MLSFYKTRNIKLNTHYFQCVSNQDILNTYSGVVNTFIGTRKYYLSLDKPHKKTKNRIKRIKKSLAKAYLNYSAARQIVFTEILLNIFTIASSLKQYKTYLGGFNYNYYKYYTVGPILKKAGLLEKNLKKSKKAMKLLYLDIEYIFNIGSPYILMLKPLNKKNYKLLKYIQSESASLDNTCIGFLNYYNTIFRRTRRIKKNIKKRLLHSERHIVTI